MLLDHFKLALKSLKHKSTRTYLTVLGILIGIAAVVALISLTQGLTRAVQAEFEAAGTDTITVSGGATRGADTLDESDAEFIKGLRGVKEAEPILIQNSEVISGDETASVPIYGATENLFQVFPQYEILQGRSLRDNDRANVILGSDINRNVFDEEIQLNNRIDIKDTRHRVVGLLEQTGDPSNDRAVMMSLSQAQNLFDKPDEITLVYIRPESNYEVSEVVETIEEELEDRRGDDDFSVTTLEQILEAVNNIISMVEALFVGIASIALIVGGVGIMNTMYTSVLEKTSDIGVMKSIGAKNSDILSVFMFESGLLGLVGGILGVTLGLSIAKGVEVAVVNYFDITLLQVAITPELLAGSLIFSILLGTVSGILPAKQAANLDPVVALRNE